MTNNQKDFNQNINAERTNLRPSSTSEQSINHENILNESIATQQQDVLSTYLQNHRVPDGVKFVDLEKLSNNAEFLTDLVSDYDRQELESVLESGSKYGVMFIDDDNVAIHNISKKELNTLSNLKDYEFDPVYKSVAKEIAQLAPNAPDTTIDLGDFTSFDPNAFEDTFLSFDEGKKALNAFDMPGKAHSKNIDNATSSSTNSNAQKEGKILGYINATEQLNRVYAKKFLKENHFELNKKNIQQISQNIAQNRANNKKQNRDSSVEAAYRIEKEKLSDPATRSNYQKSSKKHAKNAIINQTLLDQNLDL